MTVMMMMLMKWWMHDLSRKNSSQSILIVGFEFVRNVFGGVLHGDVTSCFLEGVWPVDDRLPPIPSRVYVLI